MEAQHDKFIDGCFKTNNISKETAETIWQNIKNKALKLINKYSARLKAERRENRILQSEVYAKEEQIKYLKNNVKLAQSHFKLSE